MKKMKECDHCEKLFHNRQGLRNHLLTFHDIDIFTKKKSTIPKEGKPQRRIRMMMHQAKRKRERDLISRKAISRGIRRQAN